MENREIKFRAWDISDKDKGAYMLGPYNLTDSIFNNKDIRSMILMQYTGLKDKNGKEIYEGDILKEHGIVAWNDEGHRWSAIDLKWNDRKEWHDLDYLTSPFEIIGNIYENPELI